MKLYKLLPILAIVVSSVTNAEERILASNEAYTGFADFSSVWQSFTVKENITITRIDLFAKAVGVGENFSVYICEYDPWEESFSEPSESKTILKEEFNSEPLGSWVSAIWETPIALSGGKIYRINIESERETTGYNEYAYHRPSVFAAGRMNIGTTVAYGDDLTFRIHGVGDTDAIGPYPITDTSFRNFRFERNSLGSESFLFEFTTDPYLAYIFFYYSDYSKEWLPITSNGSFNRRGSGLEQTQRIYTLDRPTLLIRAEVVNLADTRSKKL